MGHDPAQAAGLPGSLREFRSGRRCRFRRRRCGRLLNDPSIVRNRAKILATLDNARAAVALRRESDTGGLAGLVWSHRPSRTPEPHLAADIPTHSAESTALARDLKRRGFRFVGPTTCFSLMEAIGIIDTHLVGSHRRGSSGVWR